MTLRFEVTGETLQELGRNLAQALPLFLPLLKAHQVVAQGPVEEPSLPVVEVQAEVVETETFTVEAPKPDKKPRKKAEAAPAGEKAPTVDDVRTALLKLAAETSHEECFAILQEYGVRKASDLPPEKFAEVIAKINGILA